MKKDDKKSDSNNGSGLSIENRLRIESLEVQRETASNLKTTTTIYALVSLDNSITKRIEAAEKRVSCRCPQYDADNMYWKIVDKLILEQNEVAYWLKKTNLLCIAQ